MAYVQSPLPKEEQNTQAPSGTTTPNPLSQLPAQTGGSVGQGGSAGATKAAGVGSPTQFGSNASKLSDYLSANTDQVQQMGQNIAGTLNQNFSQIQGDVNQAGKDFANTVQNSYTAPNPELVGRAASNPTDFVKNPNDVSAFQSQLNDSYTGPTAFESTAPYANVQGRVNQAVQGSGLLNTHAGLSSYLQNNVEKNPTQGQNTLDTVLLESQPQAIKSVQDAAKQFSGLTDYLGQTTNQANALVAPAQQAAGQAKTGAQTALTGAQTGFSTNVNNKVANNQKAQNDYNKKVSDYLNNTVPADINLAGMQGNYGGALSPGYILANQLGTTPFPSQENDPAYRVPSPEAIPNIPFVNNAPTLGTSASSDDFATAQALDLLSGGWSGNPLVGLDQSQAGSYSVPKSIDTNPLQTDLQNAANWAKNSTFYEGTRPWTWAPGQVNPSEAGTDAQLNNWYSQLQQELANLQSS